jgi:hypothetical protein
MKFNAVTGALSALLLAAVGCSEDVGNCYEGDMKGGHDTVLVGGHVEFGGQAILNKACATGCHSSKAEGDDRHGAPAGLDFDLEPIDATGLDTEENMNGRPFAVLAPDVVNGLRARQRKVFSERNRIWQQVRDGLMPPDGRFDGFRLFTTMITDSAEASPCTRGTALKDLESKPVQDVLRNWLACQAPIVESYGGPVEVDGTAGTAGYQYLECSGAPPGDGGAGDGGEMPAAVSFQDIYDGVLTDATCTGCHPVVDDTIDFSSADKAFDELVNGASAACGDRAYVVPGDPDGSFLIDLISLDKPCPGKPSVQRMPLGSELSNAQIQQVRAWIEAGALREAAFVRPAPMSGGLDAGVR